MNDPAALFDHASAVCISMAEDKYVAALLQPYPASKNIFRPVAEFVGVPSTPSAVNPVILFELWNESISKPAPELVAATNRRFAALASTTAVELTAERLMSTPGGLVAATAFGPIAHCPPVATLPRVTCEAVLNMMLSVVPAPLVLSNVNVELAAEPPIWSGEVRDVEAVAVVNEPASGVLLPM